MEATYQKITMLIFRCYFRRRWWEEPQDLGMAAIRPLRDDNGEPVEGWWIVRTTDYNIPIHEKYIPEVVHKIEMNQFISPAILSVTRDKQFKLKVKVRVLRHFVAEDYVEA